MIYEAEDMAETLRLAERVHPHLALMDVVLRDIGFLLVESFTLAEINIANSTKALAEIQALNYENQDKIAEMTTTAQLQQQAYFKNIEHFQFSSNGFRSKLNDLIEALSPARFDKIIKINQREIDRSITTYVMKNGIKKMFVDLHKHLDSCVKSANEAQQFIVKIHADFDTEYGFKEIKPYLFDIRTYQADLEDVLNKGEAYRASAKMTLTEKNLALQKLYSTLIFQARNILFQARREAMIWGENVMSPIKNQIIDHKKQIENRLVILLAANESEEKLKENIARMENELVQLNKQYDELNGIIKAMQQSSGCGFDQLASLAS
jgi:hypothetical protein